MLVACLLVTVPAVAAATAVAAAAAPTDTSKVEASLLAEPEGKDLTFWVTFRAQADLAAAPKVADFGDRGELVVDRLQGSADTSQAGVDRLLDGRGVVHESFWISNAMRVIGPKKLAVELSDRSEVELVLSDRTYDLPDPIEDAAVEPDSVEWGVGAVRAPEVWEGFGATGEGIVVANLDTGVQFDHPALVHQYRGNEGGVFDHNYNWFDPSHVCGNPSLAPCDNAGHGTHTMGTMVGDDGTGANRIGVAPGARWIAAKGCEATSCSLTTLLAAGQWLMAPTDLNGQNPRPDLRPNVVNNSWGGGGQNLFFQDIVTSWVAAGMFPVFSNGNSGPSCGSAGHPANYADSYAVGAYDSAGVIAGFSSRGSTTLGLVKPDIAAPGVGVRSSVPGSTYSSYSGTSMAAPHVAATVALMWSAAPSLVSDVAATRAVLDQSAIDTADLTCGGTDGDNGVWGQGRLDAFAAVDLSPRGPVGTLSGVVRDQTTGQPVAGVRVRSVADGGGQPERVTSTNADGAYHQRLPVGTHHLTVEGFGFGEIRVDVAIAEDQTTVSDHTLAATLRYAVAGTVHDSAGGPVIGAQVSVPGTPLAIQATDATGAYRFPAVPLGSYQFHASGSGCVGEDNRTQAVSAATVLDLVLARKVDGFGYSCRPVAPAYIEADTVLALTGDDATRSVALPFPFSFYGVSASTAHVSTNGMVGLTVANASYGNVGLPNTSTPNGAIYPHWDDLYVDGEASIRTAVLGSEPNRRFVIEWRNMTFYSHPGRIDFEVILDQAGGIRLEYRNVAADATLRGLSATIGLENATGTVGFGYSYDQPALPPGASAVRFDTPFTATNVAPDAVADSAVRLPIDPVTVPVLANDDDPDGDLLTVTGVSDPPGGTATVNADGTVTYRPDAAFVLGDSFTYDVADGRGGTDRATVSVSVPIAAVSPPVASDDGAVTPEDTPVVVAVLANDTDPESDPLRVSRVSDPPHGTAVTNADGTVTYTPDADFNGPDSFTYDADDGRGGVDGATVSVSVSPVNDAPRAVNDSANVLQDSSVTFAVLANDTDPDGDALVLAAVADPPHGAARANADRSITYTPDLHYSGPDSFSYTAGDGHGGVHQATITVWVTVRKSIQTPLSVWIHPGVGSLDGVGNWLFPFNEPAATAGQVSPDYTYSHTFWFSDVRASGSVSLGKIGAGHVASFAVTRTNGTSDRVEVPYPWVAGRGYFLMTLHLGGGRWGGYVIDGVTGVVTTVGALTVSPGNTTLYPSSVTGLSWSGPTTGDCAAYPVAKAIVLPPTGFSGGVPRTAYNVVSPLPSADCGGWSLFGGDWAYYVLGSGA